MRLIDANALKYKNLAEVNGRLTYVLTAEEIDNAPTVEETEKPFIVECRDKAIKENLPLYFVYYEETGVFDVYITETKELFERRHCSKHISNYEFKMIVSHYLDDYSDWKGGAK